MRVCIGADGKLYVTPESTTEAFAMQRWFENRCDGLIRVQDHVAVVPYEMREGDLPKMGLDAAIDRFCKRDTSAFAGDGAGNLARRDQTQGVNFK